MKIYSELDFASFEPWSGAVDTHKRIVEAGKAEAFEAELDALYPDGMSKTQLNDLLWFEPEWCYQLVGLRTESEIREEIEAAETELNDLETEFRDQFDEIVDEMNQRRDENGERHMNDEEEEYYRLRFWNEKYSAEAANILAKIGDLKIELEKI